MEKRTIDRIPPEATREFGIWFLNKDKASVKWKKGRSPEQVNNVTVEVLSMYAKVAIRDRYISKDKFPQIDKVKEQKAYRDWETDRKSTRLNSSHSAKSRMPSSA